jgi:hypothetical protein
MRTAEDQSHHSRRSTFLNLEVPAIARRGIDVSFLDDAIFMAICRRSSTCKPDAAVYCRQEAAQTVDHAGVMPLSQLIMD